MASGLSRVLGWLALAAVFAATGCASVPGEGGGVAGDLLQTDAAAESAYRQGRHADAIEGYEALVRAVPTDAGYWYRLGNSYFLSGRYSEAAMAYEQSLAVEPGNPRAWHNLGVALTTQARDAFIRGASSDASQTAVTTQSRHMGTSLSELLSEPPPPDLQPTEPHGGTADEPDMQSR